MIYKQTKWVVLAFVFAIGFLGCGKKDELTITGWTPKDGTFMGGVAVTISGTGFSGEATKNVKVYFGGVSAKVGRISETEIRVISPAGDVGKTVDITVVFESEGKKVLKDGFKFTDPKPLTADDISGGKAGAAKPKAETTDETTDEKANDGKEGGE